MQQTYDSLEKEVIRHKRNLQRLSDSMLPGYFLDAQNVVTLLQQLYNIEAVYWRIKAGSDGAAWQYSLTGLNWVNATRQDA